MSTRIESYVNKSENLFNDQKLSASTISRLWGLTEPEKMNYLGKRKGSWTIITKLLGYNGWNDFCLQSAESQRTNNDRIIVPDQMATEQLFHYMKNNETIAMRISPDKYSILQKLDENEFKVVEQVNMKNDVGTILYIERLFFIHTNKNDITPCEIKYEYCPCFEDEDENGRIPEELLELRLL